MTTEKAPTDLADISVEEFDELIRLSTRDEAGTHFAYAGYYFTAELEAKGLIAIDRPVHEPSGVPYSTDSQTVARTELGEEVAADCVAQGIASEHYLDTILDLLGSCVAECVREGFTGPLGDWEPEQADIDYVVDKIGFDPSDDSWEDIWSAWASYWRPDQWSDAEVAEVLEKP